ncbi:MAG: hypothetical protein JWL83_1961 [Actinomycetia bacterium]|nr:hypothetical protein [Actinomycetes bacterium]
MTFFATNVLRPGSADPDVHGNLEKGAPVHDRTNDTASDTASDNEQELRERLLFERALTGMLRSFVDCEADEIGAAINDALAVIGDLTDADRAFVYLTADGAQTFDKSNEWCREGVTSSRPRSADVHRSVLARWWSSIEQLQPVIVGSTADLADDARVERTLLESESVKASVTVPIITRNVPIGCLGLSSLASAREWSPATLMLLDQFAGIIASVLKRHATEDERRRSEASLRASEERFRRLVQHSPDVVIVIDDLGTFSYASPQIEQLLGYDPVELIGTSALDLIHPDEVDEAAIAIVETVTANDDTVEAIGMRVRHRDGSWIPIEVAGSSMVDDPLLNGIVVTIRDMRDSIRTAATLEEVEIRFRQVFEHSPIGIALATPQGRFIKVNPAFTEMLGRSADELSTMTHAEVTHPDDRAKSAELHARLSAGELDDFRSEKRFLRSDGSTIWVRVSVTAVCNAKGVPLYSIGHIEDITHRKEIEQRLSYDATHDALTGLPLRTLVLDHLDLALTSAKRHGTNVAVLFIDLDRFKRVNDSLGHAAGDDLLKEVAQRLRSAVRSVDTPGRFGGDEFAVVCPDLDDVQDVVVIAERIRELFERPVELRGVQVFVGASIGIAVADLSDDADADGELLLRQADTAAYRAKERGRNRYEIFDEELRASVAKRLETESGLRRAFEHDELRLLYQPVVAIESGDIVGFEALVRWERDGELVAPIEFLGVAEETGLIVPLGEIVLDKACRQLAAWKRALPASRVPRLSVNLSARQLTQPELVGLVRRCLEDNGLEPGLLCLEITETVLMQDTPQVIATIRELRELGVDLAIDDFGTGYSSLSYLRRLPVSAVKIDRSFIMELGADNEGSTIVASVISLAHALGMEIIAEGVETIEHVAALLSLGCDHAQGFYFSRPVLPDAALALLTEGVIPVRPAA